MRILALQLKRIGDLVLTTPALVALRAAFPSAQITLGLTAQCRELFPALPFVDDALVLRGGKTSSAGRALLGNKFALCLDFTGNDRAAFWAMLSRAKRRIAFRSVRKSLIRGAAHNCFVDSSVRDHHTADHYCRLLEGVEVRAFPPLTLRIPESARTSAASLQTPYVVVHAGTARVEKQWLPERWAAVIEHIHLNYGLPCVLTGGSDIAEREHVAEIARKASAPTIDLCGRPGLLEFAAIIAGAHACLSCDTAAVHFAAAFERPQIALFGATNPFHWRPRHPRAMVISAAHPDAPLEEFDPRMRGAPMSAISTETVLRATDALLVAESRKQKAENSEKNAAI